MRKKDITTGKLVTLAARSYFAEGPLPAITVGPIPVQEDSYYFRERFVRAAAKGSKYLVLRGPEMRPGDDLDKSVQSLSEKVAAMHERLNTGETLTREDLKPVDDSNENTWFWSVVAASQLTDDYAAAVEEH